MAQGTLQSEPFLLSLFTPGFTLQPGSVSIYVSGQGFLSMSSNDSSNGMEYVQMSDATVLERGEYAFEKIESTKYSGYFSLKTEDNIYVCKDQGGVDIMLKKQQILSRSISLSEEQNCLFANVYNSE